MSNEDLKPCPFCGGTEAFVERLDYSSAYVQCDSDVGDNCVCMARGPIAVQDDDGEETPGGAGAIRAWNRRAAPSVASSAPADELPPLPSKTYLGGDEAFGDVITGYTDESMQDYARAAVLAERAACAKLCDFQATWAKGEADDEDNSVRYRHENRERQTAAELCAASIRARN